MEPQLIRIGDLDVHVTVSDRRRTVRLTVERDRYRGDPARDRRGEARQGHHRQAAVALREAPRASQDGDAAAPA